MADTQTQGELTDGFHLVVEALKLNNIETIYGVVGIPITNLARLAQAEGIRYLGFRHEQSAGNAAAISGYLKQWPGVCLTVSGTGCISGLVAVANATRNCFPMILISGSGDRAKVDLQQGAYEELDLLATAKPFAKAAFRITRAEDIGLGIARAIRTAISGRPGGVFVDISGDALSSTTDKSAEAALIKVVDPAPKQVPAPESVSRALGLLANAKRPLIMLGKGAAYAQADAAIRSFIEKTGIPFLPMSMAKGLLPDNHPQIAAAARSFVLGQADVVMLVGARLNWLLGHGESPQWAPDAKFIQIEIDPSEFDSNRGIAAPVSGDIGSAMAAFNAGLASTPIHAPKEWTDEIHGRRVKSEAKMAADLQADPEPMMFRNALRTIRDVLDKHDDVYLVNEGANTLDMGRLIIDMKHPRRRLDPGTWAPMGIGMGYAIGAAVVSGKPVVAVEGDSAFGFSGMEIETICRYHLPVVIVVFNNGGVYKGDETNSSGDPSPTILLGSSRYDKMMEAFGGKGYHVTKSAELSAALTAALAAGVPAIINCVIDPKAGVESGRLQKLNKTSAIK